jgi:hypothetical protein
MAQTTAHHHEADRSRMVFLWLWFLMLSFWPRLFILGFWIFGDNLDRAYSSWVIPVAGFLIAPSTTILYAWMYVADSNGVHGAEWLLVAFGVLLDLWMWGCWQRLRSGE